MSTAGRCIARSTSSGTVVGPGMARNSRPARTLIRTFPPRRGGAAGRIARSGGALLRAGGSLRPGRNPDLPGLGPALRERQGAGAERAALAFTRPGLALRLRAVAGQARTECRYQHRAHAIRP